MSGGADINTNTLYFLHGAHTENPNDGYTYKADAPGASKGRARNASPTVL